MNDRTCEACGSVIAGRRADARFCDARCRARYRRGERAVAVRLGTDSAPEQGTTAALFHAWFAERDLLENPLAAAALAVAARLDAQVDGAAGMAAALRQLSATMAALGGLAPREPDFVDLLKLKSDARRAGVTPPDWSGADIERILAVRADRRRGFSRMVAAPSTQEAER